MNQNIVSESCKCYLRNKTHWNLKNPITWLALGITQAHSYTHNKIKLKIMNNPEAITA